MGIKIDYRQLDRISPAKDGSVTPVAGGHCSEGRRSAARILDRSVAGIGRGDLPRYHLALSASIVIGGGVSLMGDDLLFEPIAADWSTNESSSRGA
ncbi:MAG: hypothetical protein U0736_26185 [Gemmataceae bacterium]